MTAPPTGGPPECREPAPTPGSRPSYRITEYPKSTAYRAEDGFAAPTDEDRADAELLAEAERRGYQLSCKCLDCSRPLTDRISVRYHRGPVCRARAGVTA